MTTLSAQIKDAGRKLGIADQGLRDATKAGDHKEFKAALSAWFDANNHHNALLVAQIYQRKAAR